MIGLNTKIWPIICWEWKIYFMVKINSHEWNTLSTFLNLFLSNYYMYLEYISSIFHSIILKHTIEYQRYIAPVTSKDMHTPPPFLKSGHIYMKDAYHCTYLSCKYAHFWGSAESTEKSYFRFLFFELWLIVFVIYCDTPRVPPTNFFFQKWPNFQERCALSSVFFCATFSFWDMVDFVNVRPYIKSTISQKL